MSTSLSAIVGLTAALFATPLTAGDPNKTVSREIGKQPSYRCKRPLYGLFVIGNKTRVWAVLDKSRVGGKRYDVLYFDRNADGDLTAKDERILAGKAEKGAPLEFGIGEFTDPVSKKTHTEVTLANFDKPFQMIALALKLEGKTANLCGLGSGPPKEWQHQFSTDPRKAPVFFVGTSGPLTFRRAPPDPGETDALTIGKEHEFNVLVVRRGIGRGVCTAIGYNIIPAKLPLLITLSYESVDGKRKRLLAKLRERC